jgi:hypothetical protein
MERDFPIRKLLHHLKRPTAPDRQELPGHYRKSATDLSEEWGMCIYQGWHV